MTERDGSRQMAIAGALSAGACLTTAELAAATGIERSRIADGCCRLITRGWIVRRERGCFQLSADGRSALDAGETITSGPRRALTQATPRRRRRQTVRDRIWSTIRVMRKFGLADVEMMTGGSRANVMRYVIALERAGYLTPLRKEPGVAPSSPGFCRWLLVRDTGPTAPVFRARSRDVFDANTGAFHALGGST